MDFSRLLLIAVAALSLGLAIAATHAQDKDPVSAQSTRAPGPPKPMGPPKPWKEVRGFGRVLDLSKPPVVIDEPGLYAIQQDWRFPGATTEVVLELIQITANDVTLDLHGFEIAVEGSAPPSFTLFVITGHTAEIRNGRLAACCEGATAVHSTTGGARLHHLSIYSYETMTFDGDGATISESDIVARGGIRLAGGSNLERNTIVGTFISATLSGDGNRVTDNRIFPSQSRGVRVLGNGNLVANNLMDATEVAQLAEGFEVEGDYNVLRSNTVLVGSHVQTLWQISGTGNTLDGNIAATQEPGWQARIGMEFTADGNYYGNNRMAAQVPFALGGTVQTDWGGNVGY